MNNRLNKYFFAVLTFLIPVAGNSQYKPVEIYELEVVTDTLGNDLLFYRIHEKLDDSDYYRRHIYRYNTETNFEKVFIEDYFDNRVGFDYRVRVKEYKLFKGYPDKYIAIREYCDNECSDWIERHDSLDIFGGFLSNMTDLNIEDDSENGSSYVQFIGEAVKGKDGGKSWPEYSQENNFNIPDSAKLNFPITSLSPFDNSLMFGVNYNADSIGFYISKDKGITKAFISDTLLGINIEYDRDHETVFFIDVKGFPNESFNCIEDCRYGLYSLKPYDSILDWDLKSTFNDQVNIKSHPTISGKIYVWNEDSILVSEDFGESFDVLVNPEERITGFTTSKNTEYYSTVSSVFKYDNGVSINIKSIPVSNEIDNEIPNEFDFLQNYPNPFNPSTTISFQINQSGIVEIDIYNITGKFVGNIFRDYRLSGNHSFEFTATNLSSGTYILRARLGNKIEIHKITLIK